MTDGPVMSGVRTRMQAGDNDWEDQGSRMGLLRAMAFQTKSQLLQSKSGDLPPSEGYLPGFSTPRLMIREALKGWRLRMSDLLLFREVSLSLARARALSLPLSLSPSLPPSHPPSLSLYSLCTSLSPSLSPSVSTFPPPSYSLMMSCFSCLQAARLRLQLAAGVTRSDFDKSQASSPVNGGVEMRGVGRQPLSQDRRLNPKISVAGLVFSGTWSAPLPL